MFARRIVVALLVVASALLGSSKAEAAPMNVIIDDTDNNNNEHQAEAELPMFNQEGFFALSKLNYVSRNEARDERCRLFEETLRSIYNRTRPELVSATTLAVYESAIEELESRKPPFYFSLKECSQDRRANVLHGLAVSPTETGNQQQHVQSESVVQLIELVKQQERDLAREKSRALERERGIDALLRKVIRKAGEKALNKIRVKFDEFRRDISGIMTKFIDAYGEAFGQRRINVMLTNERVGQFKNVMKGLLEKFLDNIDLLIAEQEQDDQQYVHIKEGFHQLESELGRFTQSMSPLCAEDSSRRELARSTDAQLGEFHKMLERQLYDAREYIGHQELHGRQEME